MNLNVIVAQLEAVEVQAASIRGELGDRGPMSTAKPSRAFVEAHASRLLKHAAELYAEARRITPNEERNEPKR